MLAGTDASRLLTPLLSGLKSNDINWLVPRIAQNVLHALSHDSLLTGAHHPGGDGERILSARCLDGGVSVAQFLPRIVAGDGTLSLSQVTFKEGT